MRSKLFIGVLFALAIVVGCVLLAVGRRPPDTQVRYVSTALLDLHGSYMTNGSGAAWSRTSWPGGVRGLGANGVEVGATRSSLEWAGNLWGFRWSKRFQLLRQSTNSTTWALSKIYSVDILGVPAVWWRKSVATITNAP